MAASSAALHLDLPLRFFLGLTAWLDFGLREIAGFGELDIVSCEWLRGRWLSQHDVTRDSWREAVECRV